jgi:Mce-associated membrane protein
MSIDTEEATMTDTQVERRRPRPYVADDDGATVDPPDAPPTPAAPNRRNLRTALVAAVAIVVLLGFVTVNVWLAVVRSANDGVERARVDALNSARTRVPAMLSYNYKDLSAYLTQAPTNTTGDFKQAFTKLLTRFIAPGAKKQRISTKATIKSAGVIEAHANSAVVLVMIDQTTTSKDATPNQLDGSRVRVELTLIGGKWLVSDMTPV